MSYDISALRKFVSPEIVFGAGSRRSVANFASNFGARHVFLVSDPGVVAAGWVAEVETLLVEAGLRCTTFTAVSPNPKVDEVMAGAELYRASECDVIVAIGGGSPMDCAKGIGIVASHGRSILEFEGVDTIRNPSPPLILIPTTAGTSADVSQFAIISDPNRRFKFSIISKAVVPDVSLIDPEVTETMDAYLTACTGVDALVHAIEAFVSTGSGPLTDTHALEAIRLINGNLEALVANPSNPVLREQIMLASMQAGLAFSNAILGAVHAMSHSLGGFLDLPHGLCNALLLEHVVAYNFPSAEDRFRRVAEAMAIDTRGLNGAQVKARLMTRIIELKKTVGLEARLKELGVTTSDIPYLSGYALKDPCILTNPRKSSLRDVQVVYEEASDSTSTGYNIGDLLGLSSQSARKSYYPALQERLEELEQERNRYKWLFENALHGIFQANLRGGFLACNPAMARICGYDNPEQLQKKVIRLREQLFCSAAEFDQLRQELLDHGSLSARETRLRRADQTPVYVALTMLRRPDLGPEVVETFVADITDRVQARQKLEQLNAELEKRVEERTEALQNVNVDLRYQIEEREKVEQELKVAVNAAKEANRSKDKYLAAASHDLLQPLNAARLMISALQDSQLPEAENRMVHQVHRALEGAEDLLADLLDISKLDQQAMKPDLTCLDLAAMLKGLGEEFEAVAANAGLQFRLRVPPVSLRTDPRMLARIVRNLLSNAFRYTREGGVMLSVRQRRDRLAIEIWDTGVGIESHKLQDIFTEFHQLLPQGTGGRQGVGLGLAIVERMVRVLGYGIRVTSRPGRGSRFEVSIPLEHRVIEASRSQAPAGGAIHGNFDGLAVLVIDNEPAVLESMAALLEGWGCEVFPADGESSALDMLSEGLLPDVILADFHLDNNATGCEAVYAVRRALDHDVPAAIITADRSDEVRTLLRAQYLPILNKPVKPNRLRALLASLAAQST